MGPHPTTQAQPASLDDWLTYLEAIHQQPIDLGLGRIQQVAGRLQLAAPGQQVVLVAGTNGKGSVVRLLEQLALAAGRSTGTYTSPHLVRYEERVRYNGAELAAPEHCAAFAAVEEARQDTSLTYFEFGTLAALWLLAKRQPDLAILEIGLGGRLDAVNIVTPDVSVITRIGVDHEAFLGSDREQIGREKAGIMRASKPVVCGDPEPPHSIAGHAGQLEAPLWQLGQTFDWEQEAATYQYVNHLTGVQCTINWPRLWPDNVATALAAWECIYPGPLPAPVLRTASEVSLPGRWQRVGQQPEMRLDVGHNPAATQVLARLVAERSTPGRVLAVCGMLNDKDHQATLAPLLAQVHCWWLADTAGPRGMSGKALAQSLPPTTEVRYGANVAAALTAARAAAQPDDLIICFGSFVTVSAALATMETV